MSPELQNRVELTMLTRFAPAPTGRLHLGHVLNAEYVWGLAGEARGRVLLRIEDHDRERCRPEYERGILDDLDWLGFQPDVYPTDAFRSGGCLGRQSDRDAIYREAADRLRESGLLYACDCSRKNIVAGGGDTTGELVYHGKCRTRGLRLEDGVGWRVRMDPGIEAFIDVRLGPQAQDPASQCGDVLIRDRHGNWTYQFAVAVDDMDQGIDTVIRGVDLLASTGRQIRIARLLGRERPPRFCHHALIMKSPGQKLSKSDRDTGVRDLRETGWSAREVIDMAVSALPDEGPPISISAR
jgi:glutamyl/glutaminyl-tRNA synthetase